MFASISRKVLYVLGRVTHAGCVLYVFTKYVAQPTMCIGQSMRPTINSTSRNDIVLIEHLTTIQKNDIVILRSPRDPDISICKRITAMEGEKITTCKYYTDEDTDEKPLRVPVGHVWLSGDNVDNSVDSRTYGPVPQGLILGRVCFKLYPFSEFGPIN